MSAKENTENELIADDTLYVNAKDDTEEKLVADDRLYKSISASCPS